MSWTYGKQIWDLLLKDIGNKYGVAGLMGNLVAESGLIPYRKQNDFTSGYTESIEYTGDIDSGVISESTFVNDSIGYGLAQWTFSTRKQKLYNYWKNNKSHSIGSVEVNVGYLLEELKRDYPIVYTKLKTTLAVASASDVVLLDFERPADQSEAVKLARVELGLEVYNTYSGTSITPSVRKKRKGFNFVLFKKRSIYQ